ncbi:MAG: alpha/beta fold hydrolase [Saprospiraceae bacterium]|nr:alpha/beta fold hydrolase [Saprospiraceae bacterium]
MKRIQHTLIFQPVMLPISHKFAFDVEYEEINFEAQDGTLINTLLFRTKKVSYPKGLILYFHGNKGNLQRWGNMHLDFTERGYDYWVMDYRGYGKSNGTPAETALYTDGLDFYNEAIKHYPAQDIIIYGRSLGTAVASHLAVEHSSKFLCLETPFDNMEGIFRSHTRLNFLPVDIHFDFPNNRFLTRVKCPTYIFHGTRDGVVPYSSALRLKPLLGENDIFFTIKGGSHNNLSNFADFQSILDKILGEKI